MFSRYSKVLIPFGILGVATIIAAALYLSKPDPKVVDNTPHPLLVDAIEAVTEDIQVSVRAQGTVTPRTATTLIAEVSGQVARASDHFEVGGYFKRGDALLYIDQRDYLAALKRAEAAVASARSNLATEKGRAEVAYQDWRKYSSSVKRSDAATALALRKPQLAEAQAQLDSANADLDHARDQLDRTVIRAPYDGLFKSKRVDVGQYVNVGTTLAETFAIDVAELRLALPQHKLDYLELPTLADHELDIQPSVTLFAQVGDHLQQWPAKIVRTEGVFNDRSRVLFAVAEITDPYGINSPRAAELRIGTFVDAEIEGRVINKLVKLPRDLLRAGNRIWIIDQQMQLQNRQVTILRTDGPEVYVTAGLDNGELVCASTISGAIPGTRVRIASKVPSNHNPHSPVPEINTPPKKQQIDVAPAEPAKEKSATAAARGDRAA